MSFAEANKGVNPHGNTPIFLPVAEASARLAEILRAVDQLNVIAINAQLAVARAGEEEEGFDVIARQLEAFAREIPPLIHQVHTETVGMIRELAKLHRTEEAHTRFLRARYKEAPEEGGHVGKLEGALSVDRQRLVEVRRRARENLDRLGKVITEVEHKLDAASYLTLNARVEAARGHNFQNQFETVANDVFEVVSRIQTVISEVHAQINQLNSQSLLEETSS